MTPGSMTLLTLSVCLPLSYLEFIQNCRRLFHFIQEFTSWGYLQTKEKGAQCVNAPASPLSGWTVWGTFLRMFPVVWTRSPCSNPLYSTPRFRLFTFPSLTISTLPLVLPEITEIVSMKYLQSSFSLSHLNFQQQRMRWQHAVHFDLFYHEGGNGPSSPQLKLTLQWCFFLASAMLPKYWQIYWCGI